MPEIDERLRCALAAEKPTKQEIIISLSVIGGPDVADYDALNKWTDAECDIALKCINARIRSANDYVVRNKRLIQPEFTVGVLVI